MVYVALPLCGKSSAPSSGKGRGADSLISKGRGFYLFVSEGEKEPRPEPPQVGKKRGDSHFLRKKEGKLRCKSHGGEHSHSSANGEIRSPSRKGERKKGDFNSQLIQEAERHFLEKS